MPAKRMAAIVGGGVIGGGWAARFLLSGWNVRLFDPAPGAHGAAKRTLARARRSYPALHDAFLPEEGALEIAPDIACATDGADWIQESVPERIETKREALAEIQEHCRPDAIIASSTSGFKPSDLQAGTARPGQILVAHPFNPVYLLPLAEVVATEKNSESSVESALAVLRGIGMHPLLLRREIDAHIADRLMEALWREALWLIADGAATTGEVDSAITMGFGLRWAQMGLFETYRIAGGGSSMEHFLEQFGPCLRLPWTRLMEVPEMTPEFAREITRQSDEQSGGHAIEELERIRDSNLVTIMRGLKARNWGAGKFLRECDRRLTGGAPTDVDGLMTTIERVIPPDWIDGNDHMNESRYLELFSLATDEFLTRAGCDPDYIAAGRSYFTLETSLRHLGEVREGDRVRGGTCCVSVDGKKLHLFHVLRGESGAEVATGEHLLLHVDLASRKSVEPDADLRRTLAELAERHSPNRLPAWAKPKLSFDRPKSA